MSLVFVLGLFVANDAFAQATPEGAIKAIRQELITMKQDLTSQQATSLNDATAQTEIAAVVKYRFYEAAIDVLQKYGVAQTPQKTYDLFNPNGTRTSAALDAAKTDLENLLNSL